MGCNTAASGVTTVTVQQAVPPRDYEDQGEDHPVEPILAAQRWVLQPSGMTEANDVPVKFPCLTTLTLVIDPHALVTKSWDDLNKLETGEPTACPPGSSPIIGPVQ